MRSRLVRRAAAKKARNTHGEDLLKLLAHVAEKGFGLTVWQWLPGKVGTHAPGSMHGQHYPDGVGKAFDAYGKNMRGFALWVRQHAPQIDEGIFNPVLSIKYGKAVPSSYWGAATWQAHLNHVHIGNDGLPSTPKPPTLPQSVLYATRALKAGARYQWKIIRAAKAEGVQLSLAFALVQQETGFRNVFGHDPTIYAGAGQVTKAKYIAYKRQRGPDGRGGMQGVGPCQLTWWATQDLADKEGGCWRPKINIRVGLRTLAQNIRAKGEFAGIAAYNGTGSAAQAYARSVLAKRDRWHRILTGGKS